ncbi:MAG: tyrosine-type recombinase/integrase [Thermoplasmata archaeon]|nr:tyrosine-type recombinase/integrase [Thermoplasmata archaeon]
MKDKRKGRFRIRSLNNEMSEYLEIFRKDCELRGMTHASILTYLSAVRIFLNYLKSRKLRIKDVNKRVLKEYVGHLQKQNLSYKTLGYNFTSISAFFELLLFEGKVSSNPVTGVRKRYLRRYKNGEGFKDEKRRIITVREMKRLVLSTNSPRDRAIIMLLAKTGVRRGELLRMDVDDLDLDAYSIKLKPTAKRTNRLVFFDEEARKCLLKWLNKRKRYIASASNALFIGNRGERLNRNHVYDIVVRHAVKVGLHDPSSDRLEEHFTPHCCRHWFTTYLMRSGMPREHVQELRGDVRPDAVDIYYHIDPEDLKKSYLKHIPRLGI